MNSLHFNMLNNRERESGNEFAEGKKSVGSESLKCINFEGTV